MNPQTLPAVKLRFEPGSLFARIPVGPEAGAAVSAGISLINAGDMGLARAGELPCRGDFFIGMGWPAEKVFAVRQAHTRTVVAVDGGMTAAEAFGGEADGLLSGPRSGAVLTVTAADCLPIFMYDPSTGAYALVHSGWKGTGIAREAVTRMAALYGSRARDIRVTIGPGIGPCCYRVDEERWRAFRLGFSDEAAGRAPDGQPVLDLVRANVGLLHEAGVEMILCVADCTCCTPRLGSYRRQGKSFTRMLAFLHADARPGQR